MSEKEKSEDMVKEQETAHTTEAQEAVQAEDVQAEIVEDTPAEKTLEEQLVAAQAEAAQLRDAMLRIAAESENFKKRMEREYSATLKYAGEKIFKGILPAVDNLERAVQAASASQADAEQTLKSLQEGVELTLKSFMASLEKFEVKAIDSLGQPFDPQTQEALTMAPSADYPANYVVNEFEKGYYYKDRLLRAAKVVVSSGN